MNTDSSRVETIFAEAISIESDLDRGAFLDRACDGDASLRGQLEALIKNHFRSGSFLERPAVNLGQTIVFGGESLGAQIGPYKLLQLIGEGGMGVVYMAEQREPVVRRVALKIIKPGMDSRNVIARFEAERQALAMMDHPNIAHVFDAGTTASGKPYFVMELVRGVPIITYCDANHLPPEERLGLFISVCQAVQHAHQKGVIHRDLKPSNVLVASYDGRPSPKVIDFGIAKATTAKLTEKTMFTEFGQVVGTLEYMSPEQAQFNQLDVDTRTDIYSLGVLLYELLTGTTPLERKRLKATAFDELLRMIREEEPPRPSTRLSSTEELPSIAANRGLEPKRLSGMLRGDLDWIVMKALEKDRARRYETANGLASDIRRHLANEPITACPPTARYRFAKFARRNRAALLAISLIVAALVSGTAISTWQAFRATQANASAQLAERNERSAHREAQLKLWQSYLEQAKAGRRSGQSGQRITTLETIQKAVELGRSLELPAESFFALRNEAVAALALWDMRLSHEISVPGPEIDYFSFDGQHRLYAYLDRDLNIVVRRVTDNAELCRLPKAKSRCGVILSPDGSRVFTMNGSLLQLWSITGHQAVLLLEDNTITTASFRANGEGLGLGHEDGSISVYRFDDLKNVIQLRPISTGACRYVAFDPSDARRLACSNGSQIELWDIPTQEVLRTWRLDGLTTHVDWSPQGDLLAYNSPGMAISICEIDSEKSSNELHGHGNFGVTFVFNHSGAKLVSTCWDATVILWSPGLNRPKFSMPSAAIRLQFSEDDRLITGVRDRNHLQIWEVAGEDEFRSFQRNRLSQAEEFYGNSEVSPDGRLLLVGTSGGACLWDVESGREVTGFAGGAKFAGFLADGSIWTNQPGAVQRWPRHVDAEKRSEVVYGPPEKIPMNGAYYQTAHSKDGHVIAIATGWGAEIYVDSAEPRHFQLLHPQGRYVEVDPAGRFVVTADHEATSIVKVWDAQTGLLVANLEAGVLAKPVFSHDGRLLATSGSLRIWEVGSWKQVGYVGGKVGNGVSFSPDDRYLAFESGKGEVVLADPITGHEFVRLANPYQKRAGLSSFSPDGAFLQTIGEDKSLVYRWNLRSIRQQLGQLGLDWDAPSYPTSETWKAPLHVRIDLGQ